MKTGLVMEGGAMRGLFTAGVIDVLMEEGIEFDGAIGVSAGAAFGCNYKSRQIGRVLRYNTRFCNDPRYCGLKSLITTGNLYNAEFCYRIVPTEYDIFDREAFNANPMNFYVVCTDVMTGKPYYRLCNDADESIEWMRASASLPLVSKVVELEGMKFLDGGITDSVPLKYFESLGYGKNIVILTQPEGYIKEKTSKMPLIKIALRKYPKMIEAMENRHIMYNDATAYIREREKSGDTLVIRPPQKLPVKRMEKDPEKLKEVYLIGRKAASERLAEIKDWLCTSQSQA